MKTASILWSAVATAALGAYAFTVSSCADDDPGAAGSGPCTSGICGTGGAGPAGPGSGGAGAGPAGPGSGGSGGGPPSCAWLCSPWDTEGNGDDATRTCLDVQGCADPMAKPPEAATLPDLDENFYRCNVEPIFDKYCSQLACHGVEPDIAMGDPGRALRVYHRGRMRVTGYTIPGEAGCLNQPPVPSENCIGCIECACWTKPHLPVEWQRNFDAARGLALDLQTGGTLAPEDSELLTQPEKGNGLPHAGIKIWDAASPEYTTIQQWLGGMTLASCNTTN
jgi:hypothetical protein